MIDKHAVLPASSQLSTSDLSEPPNIKDDEEFGEIHVKFTTSPTPTQQSQESAAEDSIAVLPEVDSPALSRPKRSTRATRPTRYNESDDEISAQVKVLPEASKKRVPAKRSNPNGATNAATKKPPPKRARPAPRAKKSKWDPKFVTENEKSPLVNVDLRSLLLQPAAWDCLTVEDRKEILALLPDNSHILNAGTPEARPDSQSLRNDDNFRHDCDQYVANLANGMHDPTWLKDAWSAHERRNAGQFDEFHIRKLELDWGATIPDQHKPRHLQFHQNGEPSMSTSQSTANNREVENQDSKKFTSRKFVVNTDATGQAGKKTGATAESQSRNEVEAKNTVDADGVGDSIDVKIVDVNKGSAVEEDAETTPTSTTIAITKNGDSGIQDAEGRNGNRSNGKGMASAMQTDTVDGGSKDGGVGGASPEQDSIDMDID